MAVIDLESLPLGFRFHPTDEELVNHYLKRKIDGRISSDAVTVIPVIDVCRCEPWDLPDRSVIRSADPEWFFFSPRDRKYSNSSRQHRATEAGYWKATGKDRLIKSRRGLIGMKKTLVFHRGRAPRARRTNWIMHEYRTTEPEFDSGDQGGFVLCRLFKKPEETIPSSNTDEFESSGFSPIPTRSSPSGAHHGADALEEFATPINQKLPETNLQVNSQPLPVSADSQPACAQRWLNNKAADGSTNHSLKQEESHSNSNAASDEGDCEAEVVATEVSPLLDDLSEFLGPEYEQLGSVGFPYISSPLLHTDYQFLDDLDQGSDMGLFLDADAEHESAVTEFLDAVLSNQEDDFNEGVNSQKNSVNEIMQPNASSLTDSTSPLNFIMNEPSQEMFSSHKLVGTRPSYDWSSCLAELPSQGNLIRIRARQPQYLSSNDSDMPEDVAIKRLRLQRSIRMRSASTMENKSRITNKDNCVVKVATEARERVKHQAAEEREVSDDIASTTVIKPRGLSFRRRPAGDTGTKPKGRSIDPETSRAGSTYVVGISVVLLVSLLLMCWTMVVPKLVTIR